MPSQLIFSSYAKEKEVVNWILFLSKFNILLYIEINILICNNLYTRGNIVPLIENSMHKIKSKIHIRQRTAPERKMQTIVIFNPVATLNIVEQRVETRTCNLNFTNRVCTSVIVCTSRSSFSRGVSHSVRIDGTLSGSSDQSCRGM